MDSILNTIKKMLGIEPEYPHFDQDIMIFINGVLMTLSQMGIGPTPCLRIRGTDAVWSDLVGGAVDLDAVQTFIYLKVRLLFDPPSSSYVLDSIKELIKEQEWRLIHQAEKGADTV